MKTFTLVWDIFMIIFYIVLGVVFILDYRKTKDNAEITPEDLKKLRRTNFILLMLLCLTVLVEHIDRILLS